MQRLQAASRQRAMLVDTAAAPPQPPPPPPGVGGAELAAAERRLRALLLEAAEAQRQAIAEDRVETAAAMERAAEAEHGCALLVSQSG
jgi:hypothetical protein